MLCGFFALAVTGILISGLRANHGALCLAEVSTKEEWKTSMSQCSCAVHDVADAHYLAPAYNALPLILFFAGAAYNIACKLWHPIFHAYVDEVQKQTMMHAYELLPDQRNTFEMQNTRICMFSVFAVSVVLATQYYVFFVACLCAVLWDAWWIEV